MAFEEETHQQQEEEQIQLQKQRENEQFQRELDEVITRLENEQFQRQLDEIIARLEPESQEHEEETSSSVSVSEEKSEQQNIREKLSTTKIDNHEEERTEEEQTQKQELAEIEYSVNEEQDSVRNQKNDLNLPQEQKEDPITKHLDDVSQQSPPIEEEISSYQSATEEKADTQNTHEQTTDTFEELSNLLTEILEEQQIQSQELTQTKDIERDQEVELNLFQMREENKQFQEVLDVIIERFDQVSLQSSASENEQSSHYSAIERVPKLLNPLEQSTQSSDEQSIFLQEEQSRTAEKEKSCHISVTKRILGQLNQFEKLNQDVIKEKTESGLEKEEKKYYSKQLEEATKHQGTLHHKLILSNEENSFIKQDDKKNEHSVIQPISYVQSTSNIQKSDSLSETWCDYNSNGDAKESPESKIKYIEFEGIENIRRQKWDNGYIKNVFTDEYLSSDKLAIADLLSNGCKLISQTSKRNLADYMLKIDNAKVCNNLPDDELMTMYTDIAIKTNLIGGTSDKIAVLLFKLPENTRSNYIYLKSNIKGSVVISNKGIHILTSDPDGFNLAKEIVYNGLNSDTFNARLILGENLFRKLTYQLNNDDLKQFSQLIQKAVAANKDTNSAFGITATQLGENSITQIRLTDVLEIELDKRKLIEYLKKMNPRFVRRSITDIYKYYMTYDSIYRQVVSKIEQMEKENKDHLGSFSSSYDWQGWKYINSEADALKIRYNIENLDGDATFRIQILGELTDDGKKTIEDLGKFVTEYKNKKNRSPREITYDKIRQTSRGRSLLNDIRNRSKAMLEEADIFMEDLFPMIELSKQSSNRSLSQSGTRVLNDYRIMTGPGIDYDFSIIQNYHITNEVNEIQTKISSGIGYEISFNKRKFDIFRTDLDQEVTRRALILEGFQKNILTRNGAEELPGSGNSGYYSQLLDIYESSPGKGWKDILSYDPVYQFYNTRLKQVSMSAGKLSTPVKNWEKGRITSTLIQGDRILKDIWIELEGSAKKLAFPSNFFVKKVGNKIFKEVETINRIITDQGLIIGDVKSTGKILAINRGLQRFQRGNENAGGTELFKEYLKRLLKEKRELLGKNGLGLDLKKKYSIHVEFSLAKNNSHENFNYSIGAPDVVIRDAETNDLAAVIQLKGHSQNDSRFNTSISFFQMIEAKLLTETTGIKTAFVHLNETVSKTKATGKLENIQYDWLVFNKTEKVSITDLEKSFWHTLIIRQVRQSAFSEKIFNEITELLAENSDFFDELLELAINKRVGEIIEKLAQVKNDILYNDHAQGFDEMILSKYFVNSKNGAYMTDDGINATYSIVQNNILARIDKNALREAFRDGQSSFQYRWNKTILIDCWEKQIIELLKECSSPM